MYNLGDTLAEVDQNIEPATREAIELLWSASERIQELSEVDSRFSLATVQQVNTAAFNIEGILQDMLYSKRLV